MKILYYGCDLGDRSFEMEIFGHNIKGKASRYRGRQCNTEEEWNIAYKRRVVSVAVSRKKKGGC